MRSRFCGVRVAVDDAGLVDRRQRRRDRARVGDPLRQRPRRQHARRISSRSVPSSPAPSPGRRARRPAGSRTRGRRAGAGSGAPASPRAPGAPPRPARPRSSARTILIATASPRSRSCARTTTPAPAAPQHLLDRVAAAQHHPVPDRKRLGEVRARRPPAPSSWSRFRVRCRRRCRRRRLRPRHPRSFNRGNGQWSELSCCRAVTAAGPICERRQSGEPPTMARLRPTPAWREAQCLRRTNFSAEHFGRGGIVESTPRHARDRRCWWKRRVARAPN